MSELGWTAFADPELAELFEGEPELLAIADAVAATTPKRTGGGVASASRRGWFRLAPRRTRSFVAVTVLVAVVAAAPALAFSTTMRGLVGLQTRPTLVATLKGWTLHKKQHPYGLGSYTVTFTIGEKGKAPGTGIPRGSVFMIMIVPKKGPPAATMTRAYGSNGHYTATTYVPPSGIAWIQIGGFLDAQPSPADGGFWIPITNVKSVL